MAPIQRNKRPRRRPLDDRLAERAPRPIDGPPEPLVTSRVSARVDQPDELAALAVGALVMRKVQEFGQTKLPTRSIDSLIERTTASLSAAEMMRLEVEAYEVLDWLLGGLPVSDADAALIARRDGERVLYDATASTVELLRRAIDEEFDCQIDYFSRRRGQMNRRRITPIALEAETYLRAYCHARKEERSFRLSRITRCVPVHGRPMERVETLAHDVPATSSTPQQISLLDDD